ncbi:MAG: helix-turn-helix domain-containing protein [bacterium]|nr:helix-turn-helix domain-containing protein [bacterium]
MPEEKPMTCFEIAEYLDVTPKTVRNWCSRRQIPYIKLPGGQVRFLRDQVERFVREHTVKVDA